MNTRFRRATPLALCLAAATLMPVLPVSAAQQAAVDAATPGEVAAAQLERLGNAHASRIAEAMRARDWSLRKVEGRGTFSQPAAVPPLILALSDADPRVRRIAVWGLSELRPEPVELANQIAQLLDDPDAAVRAQAARALGEFHSRPHVTQIAALLRDASPHVAAHAAHALGDLQDPSSRPALEAALVDPHPGVRAKAAWALARVGEAESILRRYGRR